MPQPPRSTRRELLEMLRWQGRLRCSMRTGARACLPEVFGGMRLADLLTLVGADQRARFLEIRCADDYYESLDMLTARHPHMK